jgi:integrase
LGNFEKPITLMIIFELFKRLKVHKMAKVQFRLRSEANKNVSIKVRLSIKRKNVFETNTGFTINPKDWSTETDLPKQKNTTEIKQVTNNLKKLDSFISNKLNTDLGNGVLIDKYWLESSINKCFNRVEKINTGLLLNHTQYIIDNANTRTIKDSTGLSKETIKSYVSFKNVVVEYQIVIKKQIQFIDLTASFIEKFKIWMLNEKKYAKNTTGRKLQMLKTICIDAEKNEIPVTPYSKTIQHFKESDKDRYIQTLSFDELEQIQNADFTNQEQLDTFKKENPELTKGLAITTATMNNARNWILLGCEIGQRGGDLLNIKPEKIRYNGKSIYIDIIQQKTNKSVTVGVFSPYVSEMVLNSFPKKIEHQRLNNILKVVCKLTGIIGVVKGSKLSKKTNRNETEFYPKYELMTSRSFRRSFATNYYKKIPTPILINITGHSKESLFLIYINKREDKDTNADLFKKFFDEMNKDKEPQMRLIKTANE